MVKILKARGVTKQNPLIKELYKELPHLRDKSLRAGINWGLKKKRYFRIKFKGLSATKALPDEHKEKFYYKPVEDYWRSKGCLTEPQKGRLGIPDVSAIRLVESKYIDEIELITTEVKRGRLGVGHLNQAYGYSKRAHRCYLASDDERKLEEYRGQAERLGIGLLYINPKTLKITEKLSAPRSEPSTEPLMNHIAEVFNLVQCAFCNVFFRRDKDTPVMKRPRALPYSKSHSALKRFVCSECEKLFPANAFTKPRKRRTRLQP